jgi:hypothetical protein
MVNKYFIILKAKGLQRLYGLNLNKIFFMLLAVNAGLLPNVLGSLVKLYPELFIVSSLSLPGSKEAD